MTQKLDKMGIADAIRVELPRAVWELKPSGSGWCYAVARVELPRAVWELKPLNLYSLMAQPGLNSHAQYGN